MTFSVRPARVEDGPALQAIEIAAGQRFAEVGMPDVAGDDPTALTELAVYARNGRAWSAVDDDDRVVGYLLASFVDGNAHIDQVTVEGSAPWCNYRPLHRTLADNEQSLCCSTSVTWDTWEKHHPEFFQTLRAGSLGVNPGQKGFADLLRALVLGSVLVDADEVHNSGIGWIGEVRNAMRLHALCELQFLGEGKLVLRGGGYPAWEEVAARLISRDELRRHSIDTARGWRAVLAAVCEVVVDLAVAGRVGEVRYAM